MRTSILSYLLLFLTAVLATVPASYGQEDPPPTIYLSRSNRADFKSDVSWNARKPLTYVGNNVVYVEFFASARGGSQLFQRVVTAHSPGSVAGKWQYKTASNVLWTDLPVIDAGKGFLLGGRGVNTQIRFIPLVDQAAVNDASLWVQLSEAVANAGTPPTFSYRAWDASQGTAWTVATLADLGNSLSTPDTEKTIFLEAITDIPPPAGTTESANNPRFRAYFNSENLLLADFSTFLQFAGLAPQNAAGEDINGRVITAYSSGSVAGKWQYKASSSSPSPWTDLPAVAAGEGFLLAYGVAAVVRFVPLDTELDNVLAAEQFAELVANADTPPTLSFRVWDESEGTAETVATLADISTSVLSLTNDRTLTLNGVTTRVGREAEEKAEQVAAEEKDAKVDALAEVSAGILSAVQSSPADKAAGLQRDTEINTLKAAATQRDTEISTLKTSATQRDAEISALKTAIAALQGTGVATNPGTDPVNTNDPATTNDKDAVLHVVAASSADEGTRAYPNPTSRLLQVAGLAPAQTYTYRLYTAAGKQTRQGTLQTNEPIDISSLGQGQYLLTIHDETGKQLFTTPLVVQ